MKTNGEGERIIYAFACHSTTAAIYLLEFLESSVNGAGRTVKMQSGVTSEDATFSEVVGNYEILAASIEAQLLADC
jgi:hypothetical protein